MADFDCHDEFVQATIQEVLARVGQETNQVYSSAGAHLMQLLSCVCAVPSRCCCAAVSVPRRFRARCLISPST